MLEKSNSVGARQYTTIVVGTDGSSLAKPTVARAATVAAREDGDLVIVCAYTPMSRRTEAKNLATVGGDTRFDQVPGRDAAVQALKQAQEVAIAAGARTVATELVDADAVAALLHVGKQRKADLIVIGAIRDRSIAGRLLGTVATQVIQRAHCDVLVIRPAPEDPEPNRPESG